MKQNVRNVKNSLKHVISASIRILFKKGTVQQCWTYLEKTRLERCLKCSPSASSGPAKAQCNKWSRKRLSWFPYDIVPLSQQSYNVPQGGYSSRPNMRCILQAEMLWVTGALLKFLLRRAWQLLQSRSWPTKSADKGRNVYVMVVRTLLERVRGDLCLVGKDGADALIWAPDVVKNASVHFRGKFHGSKCHGLWAITEFVHYLADGCYIILSLLRSRKYEECEFIFIFPGKDCKSGLDCKIGSIMLSNPQSNPLFGMDFKSRCNPPKRNAIRILQSCNRNPDDAWVLKSCHQVGSC